MTISAAPRHWEADVLLRDGRTAHVRPVRPEDEPLMVAFYALVSDTSKYYRFFAPMPELSEHDLHRFTHVDHVDRVALVVLLGGEMIAVGRYERTEPSEAEVAFLVQDKHQGRGIGQLLLEHLAQAGRERGIERFTAEVLPDNQAMIHTFREAGYRVASEYDQGVMTLEFSIDPTDTAIGVMEQRDHRAAARSIERFVNARSVAVIGASRRPDSIGQALVRNLVLGDYTGKVYVVNPTATPVSGLPAYATVNEIPGEVDIAVVAVPADSVQDVVLDCAAKGVHGLIVISSGFAETGEEGRLRQRRLVGLARSYGLRLIGPNCLGLINTDPGVLLNASLSQVMPPRGRAGFFCQSGALGSAILKKVYNRGLGLSTFVSAGNRADLSGNDLLQYWEEDESTEVVLLYLESIGNPRKFSRIARRVSRRKPVVAVRSGRTTQGVPMGHAVRKIGAPAPAIDAMFRQAGIIQVETLDEMFDVAQLVAHQPLPRGRRIAVVGNSDALGLLASDAAAAVGLVVNRSVSLGPDAGAEDFEDALDAAIDDPDIDSVVAVYIPPLNTTGVEVANVLAAVGEQSDKPLVTTFLGAEGVPELLRVPDVAGHTAGRGSVPSYPAVEAAVRALARVVEYAVWLRHPPATGLAHEEPLEPDEPSDPASARRQVNELLDAPPGRPRPGLRAGGGPAGDVRHRALGDPPGRLAGAGAGGRGGTGVGRRAQGDPRAAPEPARPGPRLAQHRDRGGDGRGLAEPLARHHRPGQRRLRRPEERAPGVPVSISFLEDPLFGPVVSFSIAGPLTEMLADRSYRIPPLSPQDAADMVREVKSSPLLFGYRGSEVVDVEELERLIRRVSRLQHDLPQVRSLDLSLVQVGTEGAAVLSASVRVEPVIDPRSDWFVRRLMTPPGDTLPTDCPTDNDWRAVGAVVETRLP